MTIACDKDKPSGQVEPAALNKDFTSSGEPTVNSMENEVSRGKPSSINKDSASCSKARSSQQQGARRDSCHPPTSYNSYYYPGYGGAYGLRDRRSFGARDGFSTPNYFVQPLGLMKYYGPSGVYPPARYPKQGPSQNGAPTVHRPKPRILNENSRPNSGDRRIRKVDSEASDELTRGPRVNTKNDGVESTSGLGNKYNSAEFPTEYEHAKFYIIKSYSEDDVHKCVKYDVWSSTLSGNKKLDAAFHDREAKAREFGKCPLFLFFSVNGSGQFVGIAEMIGKVDFNKTMEFWQQDKWSGFFPVRWHIIKDIPNARLRHILLDSNGSRNVTYTRDTQEIGLKEGLEMLKIFKGYSAKSSILDDFEFYENREKALHSRKSSINQKNTRAVSSASPVHDSRF